MAPTAEVLHCPECGTLVRPTDEPGVVVCYPCGRATGSEFMYLTEVHCRDERSHRHSPRKGSA